MFTVDTSTFTSAGVAFCVAIVGLSMFAGLIAVVSPNRFAMLVYSTGRWVDTNRWAAFLDRRVDIDRFIHPHSRIFGCLVLASLTRLIGAVAGLVA